MTSSVERGLLVTLAVVALSACSTETRDAGGEAEPAAASAPLAMPPGTDVWIAQLSVGADGLPRIGEPANVTGRPGYDNQPHFLPDGSGFWYTAVDEDVGQADIWRYDFAGGTVARVTASSPESEYSATPLPDGTGISVVRVEADSTQRLWRFDAEGGSPGVLLEDVSPVGYHVWADERTLVVFVLGDPPTLQRVALGGAPTVIASDIGRSIQRMPGSNDVSFVQREEDGGSTIMRLAPGSDEPQAIAATPGGGDFHAWTPDGTLIMADGARVYALPGGGGEWTEIADFSALRLLVSRIAVSPDGLRIALVAEVSF